MGATKTIAKWVLGAAVVWFIKEKVFNRNSSVRIKSSTPYNKKEASRPSPEPSSVKEEMSSTDQHQENVADKEEDITASTKSTGRKSRPAHANKKPEAEAL